MNDILEKITKNKPVTVNELNNNIVFKVAQTNFLNLGKIIYIGIELKKVSFLEIKVIKPYILIFQS